MEPELRGVVGESPKVTRLAAGFAAASGPVFSRRGYLLFCDAGAAKIWKWESGGVTMFRDSSNQARALTTEFRCTTDGKECLVEGTKISLWYDGAVLVELDVGSEVVSKSSMKLGTDGKSMSVDVVYIVPQGDGDKLVLEKI